MVESAGLALASYSFAFLDVLMASEGNEGCILNYVLSQLKCDVTNPVF